MKKILLFLFALLLWAGSSWAQVSAYTFTGSSGTYTEITGGTLLGTTTSDDQRFVDPAVPLGGTTTTGPGFPIGFNFTYGGVVFDRVAINNNGWISLGQSALTPAVNIASTSSYNPMGSTTAISPDDLVSRICGLAFDQNGQTGSELRIETVGTTPNQECVIQWKGYRGYNATGDNLNYQIRLQETTNKVIVVYGTMTKGTVSKTAQVGLRGAPSATATNYVNRATTTDWAATTAGASVTATCTLSSTVFPVSGQTFTWQLLALPPSCALNVSPADAAADVNVLSSLNWASGGGGPTGYRLYFGTDGGGTVPPTDIVNGVDQGNVLTYAPAAPLAYSTTYYWQVIAYNANGDATGCPIWSFTTGADPTITAFPHLESFDGVTFAPYGWTNVKTAGTSIPGIWDRQTVGTYPTCTTHSGLGMARYNCYSISSGGKAELVTPPINFPTDSYRVSFWMYRDNGYLTTADLVNVYYNTAPNTTGASLLGTINRSIGLVPIVATTGWYSYIYNMPTGSGGAGRYVIFESVSAYGNNIFIDDVTLEAIPSCLAPLLPYATDITSSSANLTWTPRGTETAWEYVYGLTPLEEPTGSGTATSSSTINPIFTLTQNTNYDFYVRANCGEDFSAWTGPASFYTGYCIPAPTSVDDLGITNVAFSSINNTPPVLPVPGNYGDYSDMIGDVNQAATVPVDITFETGYTYDTKIWIDWDDNLNFTDPGDEVYSGTSTSASPTTLEASFTVPAAAPLGNHRMRIGAADAGFPDPCYTGTWGIFHDYTVNVVEPLPSGTLQGHVYDPSGEEAIDNATVYFGTSSTLTDINGFYQFTFVPVGTYDVTFEKTGYQTTTAVGVEVLLNQTTTHDTYMQYQLDPPERLAAVVQNQYDVHLTWREPGSTPPDQWLAWDDGVNWGGVGYNAPAVFSVASRWPVEDIGAYDGMYLTKVAFFPRFASCVYTIQVWTGVTPPTLVYSQEVVAPTILAWNEITLTTPVLIDGADEFWFGYECNTTGSYPAGADAGPAVAGKGDMMYNGANWVSIYNSYAINRNWNLQGWVSGSATLGPLAPMVPETKSVVAPFISTSDVKMTSGSGTLQVDPTTITNDGQNFQQTLLSPKAPSSTWPVSGYNVYRDGTKINTSLVPVLFYDNTGLAPGTYEYTVTAVYPMGESPEAAGPVEVTIYSCAPPTDLQVPMDMVTTTSATAVWTPSAFTPTTEWVIEYGLEGFEHGTGTEVFVSPTPEYEMTSLLPGTSYDFYARTYCGEGDLSTWVKTTFRTHYFDCPEGSVAELEACGDTTNNGCNLVIPTFEPIDCGVTICGTGWFDGGTRDTDWFTFTLTETTDVTLTGSAEFSHIFGFIAAPCPVTTFIDYVTGVPGASSSITLQLEAGDYYAFAAPLFEEFVDCGSFDKYFITMTCSTCLAPVDLTADVTETSALLGWTSTGTLFNVEWGLSGFTPGEGTLVTGVANPYLLEALTGATAYDFYVQTDCGEGTLSGWTGPYTFTTVCPVYPAPWTEGFEDEMFFPLCWSGTTTLPLWSRSTDCGGYGLSGASAMADFYSYSSGEDDLITLAFDATTVHLPVLKFDFAYATYSGEVDELDVYYSVDGGITYDLLLAMPGGIDGILNPFGIVETAVYIPLDGEWSTQELALPAGTNMVKFTGITAYGNELYIDNVRVEGTPIPENLLIENETITDGESNCYNATQTITVEGLVVESGGSAILIAGQNIKLMPGTTVANGGYLHGYITTTGTYCGDAAETMVTKTIEVAEVVPEMEAGTFFKVYPNPTNDKFYLELDPAYQDAQTQVQIYGMVGGLIQKQEVTGSNRYEFSLGDKTPGIYFIRVMTGDRFETKKIIKK